MGASKLSSSMTSSWSSHSTSLGRASVTELTVSSAYVGISFADETGLVRLAEQVAIILPTEKEHNWIFF